MAPITIVNPSFEDPALAPGGFTGAEPGDIPGWTITPFQPYASGIVYPPTQDPDIAATDGNQVAWIAVNAIVQSLSTLVGAETRYTLSADIAWRWGSETSPLVTLDLLVGATVIAHAESQSLQVGSWTVLNATYTALGGDPYLGQALSIRIATDRSQIAVDNVRLEAVAVVPPPTISAVTRPQSGEPDPQSVTITGTNFPSPPTVTITDPNSQAVSVSVTSSSATSITVQGVFNAPGFYSVVVDGSTPYSVEAYPPIPSAITSVTQPQAGLSAAQSVTITGTRFRQPATVTISGPDSQPVSLSVTSSSLTSITVSGVFLLNGNYSVTVNDSAPYIVASLPPIVVPPTISNVTQPQAGQSTPQDLTITGTDFPSPPTVTILGPDTQPIATTVQSAGATQIVVRGVFSATGSYTVTVNDSAPYVVQALPPIGPTPTITSVTRPTAAQGSQSVTITGTDFPSPPDVTITGPDAQPITLSVISATATQITVTGIFPLAGTYHVVVSGSAPFAVDSAPPVIASVLPPLVSGWAANQLVSIIGSGFHPNPTVTLRDPDGAPRSLFVSTSTSNAILANVSFPQPGPPGTYTLTVDDSPPFAVVSVPRPVITAIDPIYHGITETQDIVIHGTGFAAGQLVQVRDPQNQLINTRILSVTPTAITVRGSFFQPGNYTFTVWVADPVTVTSVAKPPTITYTGPIFDDRSSAGSAGGVLTIGGYGFTASQGPGHPPYPTISITDPNGQPVAFDFNNSADTWISVYLHPPLPPGEYTITVDGSPPWQQQSIPFTYSEITAVDPAPQAGTFEDQYLTLTGTNFPTDAAPSVIVSDPSGQSVTVTVIPPWTSTSVTVRGVFNTNGLWGFRIGQGAIFYINSIPPVGPVATIQAVTRPATGSDAQQFLTIQGTLFNAHPTVRIVNPSGQDVPFTLLYGSTTAAVISGVFNQLGTWTVYVDNSAPFTVEALPEPATITAIERPQAGLDTTQTIRIDGTGFTGDPHVTVTGPSGQPIDVSIVSSTETAITITLPADLLEGVYYVSADYSPPFAVLALPIPAPTITAVTPPQSGLTDSQTITLTGTWFRDPVSVTVIGPGGFVATTVLANSRTSIDLTGVFIRPGNYSVTVMADGRTSLPFSVTALPPAPPIITDVTRPQAGQTSPQLLTLTTTGYLTGPAVTVLGPDGVSIPVTLVSAPSAPLGGLVTVSGVFEPDGLYTVSVDGSLPFQVQSLPPIPVITAVTPRPTHGVEDQQTVIIEGLHFSPSPTVRVTDPQGNDVPVTILSRTTSRTTLILTVSGVFLPEGTYWFYVDHSAGFPVQTVAPPATITDVTPPHAGETDPQLLTITGRNFSDNPIVSVTDPYGVPVPVVVVSTSSGTTIVIRGIFLRTGRYMVTVDDSQPFGVDAIPPPPPPPFITHPIKRVRQWALPTSPDHRWMFVSRLELLMRTGIGLTRGKGSDPKVMLQLSRDGGKTWSSEEWRSAGETGAYLRRVRWLRQGRYRDGVIRLTVSDPVDWQLLSLSGDLTEGSH